MTSHSWTKPAALAQYPELAILAGADELIELVVRALVAAHPDLDAQEIPYYRVVHTHLGHTASLLISAALKLHDAIAAYRAALADHEPPSADMPF